MGKKAWIVISLLPTLLSVGWHSRADDQFTPVVISPLAQKTQPVLGTDGKYHAVYELTFANTRPVTATLKKVEVLDDHDPPRVMATYESSELLARLRTLGNSPAGNPEIEFNGTRLFLIDLSFDTRTAVPPRLFHHVELLGAHSPGDPTPGPNSYTVAPFDLATAQAPV